MTVATENAYAERSWTGVETSFAPGFSALDVSHVTVQYQATADDLPIALTRGTHFSVTLGVNNAVTVTPLALPAATPSDPGLLIIGRETPATQGVDFVNLAMYDPAVHTGIADRLTLIVGEIKDRIRRLLQPFTNIAGVVDFRPLRVKAADPVDDADVATKLWVLTITGILDLTAYVAAAAASAAAAAASVVSALSAVTQAQDARDRSQAWAETAEDTPVTTGPDLFSAHHWANKAAAAAAPVLAALAVTDYGFVADAPTETRDYGTVP